MEGELRYPRPGELWRTVHTVSINRRRIPAGSFAIVTRSNRPTAECPTVFDMSILIGGEQVSVYSSSMDWELVSDA